MNDDFFQPVSGSVLPRFAGVPSFMRLPVLHADHQRLSEVDVGFFGIPWDGGTSNRPGARHGPRALRDASTMIRAQHPVTGVRPFEAMKCADLGDVAINPVEQDQTFAAITEFVENVIKRGARPFGIAGDHLCTLPVLRGVHASGQKPALLLYDSHTDLFPQYFGSPVLTHGNPFRVAVEEGLIDTERSVMIGIRGTMYDAEDRAFAKDHDITVIPMHEAFETGLLATVERAKAIIGDAPTYFSFDIDFIDPAFAPGTGTPEVGGPTSAETLDMIRAAAGLNLVGCDLVEVSPPFDTGGITSWLGASVMFEMLCLMAGSG